MFRLTASAQFSVILSLLAFKSSSCSGQSASEPGEDTQTTAIPESVPKQHHRLAGLSRSRRDGNQRCKGSPTDMEPGREHQVETRSAGSRFFEPDYLRRPHLSDLLVRIPGSR